MKKWYEEDNAASKERAAKVARRKHKIEQAKFMKDQCMDELAYGIKHALRIGTKVSPEVFRSWKRAKSSELGDEEAFWRDVWKHDYGPKREKKPC